MPSAIKRPKDILPWAGRNVGPLTEAEYRHWHFYVCQSRPSPIAPWSWQGRRIAAEIHRGKWVAICPQCANGALVHPEWPIAYCGECGGVLRVSVPKNWAAIERLLEPRPVVNQGWRVGETLADLRAENRAHRIRVPRARRKAA